MTGIRYAVVKVACIKPNLDINEISFFSFQRIQQHPTPTHPSSHIVPSQSVSPLPHTTAPNVERSSKMQVITYDSNGEVTRVCDAVSSMKNTCSESLSFFLFISSYSVLRATSSNNTTVAYLHCSTIGIFF